MSTWSSYGHNAQGEITSFIKSHLLYQQLDRDAESRRQAYRELFRYELDPGWVDEIRKATNGGFVLGAERFQKEVGAISDGEPGGEFPVARLKQMNEGQC